MRIYYNVTPLYQVDTFKEAYEKIYRTVKKPEYIREWYDPDQNKIVIDFGSWNNFIYITNLQEQNLTEYYSLHGGIIK